MVMDDMHVKTLAWSCVYGCVTFKLSTWSKASILTFRPQICNLRHHKNPDKEVQGVGGYHKLSLRIVSPYCKNG